MARPRFAAPLVDAVPAGHTAEGDPARWIHELSQGLLADKTAQRIPRRCLDRGHQPSACWTDRCQLCGRRVDGTEDPGAGRQRSRDRKGRRRRQPTAA